MVEGTNGILLGCPPSVILINFLTTIWEIENFRLEVCVAMAALPLAVAHVDPARSWSPRSPCR